MAETVQEVEPWRDVRLRCAIGHRYPGRMRTVRQWSRLGFHADSEVGWGEPTEDFDPKTCVVCGLITYATET
jgi:hypothetical protein